MGKEKIQPESFPASSCTALWVRTSIAEVATAIDILQDHRKMVSKSISRGDHLTTVADPNGWRWWSQPVNNGWLPLGLLVCSCRPPNTPQLVTPAGQIEKRKKKIEYSVSASKFSMFQINTAGFIINPVVQNNYIIYLFKYIILRMFPSGGTLGRGQKMLGMHFARSEGAVWCVTPDMDGVTGPVTVASKPGDNCHQGCIHCALSYQDRIGGSKTHRHL